MSRHPIHTKRPVRNVAIDPTPPAVTYTKGLIWIAADLRGPNADAMLLLAHLFERNPMDVAIDVMEIRRG